MRTHVATVVLLSLILGVASYARADAAQAPGLDFDLFGEQSKTLDPRKAADDERARSVIDRKVRLRRHLLKAHQIAGLTTLVLLASTLVVGQLNWYHKFGGGDFTESYNTPHAVLAGATSLGFATTGVLALAAPNPFPKRIKLDSALLHKISMAVATAGMVTQLILGPISSANAGTQLEGRLAVGHLATGYLTFAAMAVGVFAYVF